MKKFCLSLSVLAIVSSNFLYSRTATETVDYDSPKLPQADEALSISGVSKAASICVNKNAGKILYTIVGGKAPYTVRLLKGDGTPIASKFFVQDKNGFFSNLKNGTYKFQVVDSDSPVNIASSTLIVVNNSCKLQMLLCCCK